MGLLNFIKEALSQPQVGQINTVSLESMDRFPNIGYQFQKIKMYQHTKASEPCYLIDGTNADKAKADLEKINQIIKEHAKVDKAFSKFQINVDTARFTSENIKNGYDDFCCLYCSPLTPTGKPAKFPLKMRVRPISSDEEYKQSSSKRGKTIHGWIYYLADGSIGKVEIYCWQGDTGYFIEENYTLKSKKKSIFQDRQ